ncbi:MAG: hypothetical protein HC908_08560 [Calothrix sp. SM1_7_51]|nr:hypothetical protein [Calothrix sp. SM1_7_51]
MAGLISAEVSKRKLKFTPLISSSSSDNGNGENEFDVIVTNESNKLVSFQLELEVFRKELTALLNSSNSNSKESTAQNLQNSNNSYSNNFYRNNSNGNKYSSAELVNRNLNGIAYNRKFVQKYLQVAQLNFM